MMRWLKTYIGPVVFWLGWPVWWKIMHATERSRVMISVGDSILLVRGTLGGGEWALPGGGLHPGENAAIGACREIYEELGIVVTADQMQLLAVEPTSNRGIAYTAHFFLVILSMRPDILTDLEIADVTWTPMKDLYTVTADRSVRQAATLVAGRN